MTDGMQKAEPCPQSGEGAARLDVKRGRSAYFDYLKLGCIFLVVFAHFLEGAEGGAAKAVYKLIYLFHIPLFVFISGYFSRFAFVKTVKRVLVPYAVFQVLYTLFAFLVLGDGLKWNALYKPYWLMWYLLSLFIWKTTVFVLEKLKTRGLFFVLVGAVLAALALGFLNFNGYRLSLSRTVVFYPFFVAGYLFKRLGGADRAQIKKLFSLSVKILSAVLTVTAFAMLFVLFPDLDVRALYGSFSYAQVEGYHVGVRAYVTLCGALGVVCALVWTPKKESRIAALGKNTLTAYLLHGFIVRLLERFSVMQTLPCPILFALLFAALTIALCAAVDGVIARCKRGRRKEKIE